MLTDNIRTNFCATCKEQANRIEAQAAEIERLRKAGTKLAGYAGHDDNCEDVTGAYPGSCSCGYTNAWKAWAALGGAE